MKKIITLLSLLLAAVPALPGSSAAAPAPDFKLTKILNAPVTRLGGLKSLKGKVVYLDFWATWCPPCVASLPRINRLHEALKDQPVVFIEITDEPADKIAAFMKTHDIKGWVAIDRKKYSLAAYKVKGRPDGYLIGKDGVLLARIYPGMLSEDDLRAAISGKFKPQPMKWAAEEAAELPAAGANIFEIIISAAHGEPGMTSSPGEMELKAYSFADNVAEIWDVQASQVLLDTAPVDSFNVSLKTTPGRFAEGREALKAAVQSAFGVRIAPEQQETDVYTLTLSTAPGAPRPTPAASQTHKGLLSYGGGKLLGVEEMPRIARAIWLGLDKPVVDETGLKGVYEFDLKWKYNSAQDAGRVLEQHGLVLTPALRSIEYLRVTSK